MNADLLLDLQACQSPSSRQRGIGRYVWHLFESLWPLIRGRWRIGVLCSAEHPVPHRGWLRSALASGEATLLMLEGLEPEGSPEARRRNQRRYAAAAKGCTALLIGSPFEHDPGIVVPDNRDGLEGVALFAVLYDLIPYLFRDRYLADPVHSRGYYARLQLLREADGLLAISEATRGDAIRHLDIAEGRIVNIFGGVGPDFAPLLAEEQPAAERTLQACGIARPFLLYTGGDDWRKNIGGLIEAYSRLPAPVRDAHQLVIVCRLSAAAHDAYRQHMRHFGLADDVVLFPGYVSDDALRHLCATCVGLVFPSFYEGFGLPVAETIACGRPAIIADAASLPELVPDPSARFDPADPAEMAQVIERLLTDAAWRDHLIAQARQTARELSWEAVAHRALAALQSRLSIRRQAPARKPRLALFAPIPPQASGIADYSASLALQLARDYRITWVTGGEVAGVPPELTSTIEITTAAEFERRLPRVDCCLYQVGNSDFHLYQLPFVLSHPGLVALHEIGLEGMAWLADESLPGGIAGLYPSGGGKSLGAAVAAAGHSPQLRARLLADALLWRMAAAAAGIVVHSHHALALLQRNLAQHPPAAAVIPLGSGLAGPPPSPLEKRRLRARFGLAEDAFIVAAYGILDPIKGIDLLVESVRMLPEVHRRRLFVLLVGYCDQMEWLQGQLQALAASGIAYRHTGRLREADYVSHLRLADLGVSLRLRSRGESSAALMQQLAHGLPSVAADLGSFAEIPDDVLVKVPLNAETLSGRIGRLMEDPGALGSISEAAERWLRLRHWPRIAENYAERLRAL